MFQWCAGSSGVPSKDAPRYVSVPAETRRTEGNPGKREIVDGPDFADGDSLAPPKRWKKKGFEREEWDRIVPELTRCNIAKAVHQGALEVICELYAAGVHLWEREDHTGRRMVAAEYRKACNEFGLTAASAGRVGGATAIGNKDEDAEEFFTGPQAVSG